MSWMFFKINSYTATYVMSVGNQNRNPLVKYGIPVIAGLIACLLLASTAVSAS